MKAKAEEEEKAAALKKAEEEDRFELARYISKMIQEKKDSK